STAELPWLVPEILARARRCAAQKQIPRPLGAALRWTLPVRTKRWRSGCPDRPAVGLGQLASFGFRPFPETAGGDLAAAPASPWRASSGPGLAARTRMRVRCLL